MGMREGSDPLALSRGAAIRGSCFFRFFARTRSRGCERVPTLSRSPTGLRFAAPTSFVSSHELAAEGARGFRPSRALPWDCDSWLLLFLFLLTNSQPGMREGSDPLALSRGAAIRGSCFFRFFSRTRSRGSERVPSLSLSPMGAAIRGSYFFCFFEQTRRRGCERVSSLSRSPVRLRFAAPYFFYFFPRTRRRGCERVPTLSRSPVGAAIRGFLLLSRLRSFPLILPA